MKKDLENEINSANYREKKKQTKENIMIIIKLFSSRAGLKDGKKLIEKPTTERNTWGKIKNSSISNGTISGTKLASSSADTVDRNVTEIAVISPVDK